MKLKFSVSHVWPFRAISGRIKRRRERKERKALFDEMYCNRNDDRLIVFNTLKLLSNDPEMSYFETRNAVDSFKAEFRCEREFGFSERARLNRLANLAQSQDLPVERRWMKLAAIRLLGEMQDESVSAYLFHILRDRNNTEKDEEAIKAAIAALGRIGETEEGEAILEGFMGIMHYNPSSISAKFKKEIGDAMLRHKRVKTSQTSKGK